MHVVHGDEKRELAFALHDPEGEAAPLQGTGYRDGVLVNLLDAHVALVDRLEFDLGRIGDRVPDESAVVGAFEPTTERVVSAQVGVQREVHGGDIAFTLGVAAGDDLPGEVQAGSIPFVVVT